MPTYQYRCSKCDGTFEAVQTMAEKPLKTVPSTSGPCGQKCKAPVIRVLSVPNVNLRQGRSETIQKPTGEVVKHWDGRQDATVRAPMVSSGARVPRP